MNYKKHQLMFANGSAHTDKISECSFLHNCLLKSLFVPIQTS